jgi:hypothetical protein
MRSPRPNETSLPRGGNFILNAPNYVKQDCEINAAKRLIPLLFGVGCLFNAANSIILGDDLYSRMPFIQFLINNFPGIEYIFTCKPPSHKYLFEYIKGLKLPSVTETIFLGEGAKEICTYRWLKNVDIKYIKDKDKNQQNNEDNNNIKNKKDKIHFIEITIKTINHKKPENNKIAVKSFITNITPNKSNIKEIAKCAKARWKIENGQFNTMKTQGYGLDHNFGHGRKTLATVIVCLCALAFNLHVLANIIDPLWKEAQARYLTTKAFPWGFKGVFSRNPSLRVFRGIIEHNLGRHQSQQKNQASPIVAS